MDFKALEKLNLSIWSVSIIIVARIADEAIIEYLILNIKEYYDASISLGRSF